MPQNEFGMLAVLFSRAQDGAITGTETYCGRRCLEAVRKRFIGVMYKQKPM